MAASTQKLALKVMRELANEKEIQPSLLNCRLFREIASKYCRTDSDIDRVHVFIIGRGFVDGCHRDDGFAVLPNENGLSWIDAHREKWTLNNRIAALGIILAFIGLLVSFLQSR